MSHEVGSVQFLSRFCARGSYACFRGPKGGKTMSTRPVQITGSTISGSGRDLGCCCPELQLAHPSPSSPKQRNRHPTGVCFHAEAVEHGPLDRWPKKPWGGARKLNFVNGQQLFVFACLTPSPCRADSVCCAHPDRRFPAPAATLAADAQDLGARRNLHIP